MYRLSKPKNHCFHSNGFLYRLYKVSVQMSALKNLLKKGADLQTYVI